MRPHSVLCVAVVCAPGGQALGSGESVVGEKRRVQAACPIGTYRGGGTTRVRWTHTSHVQLARQIDSRKARPGVGE